MPRQVIWLQQPIHAAFYITTRCNLRCRHCYISNYTSEMPASAALEVVDALASIGTSRLSLLGGEPLVRDDLEHLVHQASSRGIRPLIGTNGTLMSAERARSLITSGCTDFQISLEGHDPGLSDPVRGNDTFRRAIAAMRTLRELDGKVSLNVVISRANYPKISEIAHVAAENGAHFLRLSAFIPQGSGQLYRNLYGLDRRIVGEVRRQIADLLPRTPVPIIEGAFKKPSPNACGETFGCGAGTHSLTINPDLSLGACDLLSEHDRTRPLESAAQILETWRMDGLFEKWRGRTEDPEFKSVHQHGCHLAMMRYGENIFA